LEDGFMSDTTTLRVSFYYFDGHENAPALLAFVGLGTRVLRTIGEHEQIRQGVLVDPRWRRFIAAEWAASDLDATGYWLALRSEGNVEVLEQVNVP
jgi:hypothetical protein